MPFGYYKYQIYSPYLSVQDIVELCCTCKYLKNTIYKLIFAKCVVATPDYYVDFNYGLNPKMLENKSSLSKYKVFMENGAWDTNRFGQDITMHIPISLTLNQSIIQIMRDVTFTVGSEGQEDLENGSDGQSMSIFQLLTPERMPYLKTLKIILKSNEEWKAELVKELASNFEKYKNASQTVPWLSLSVLCNDVFNALELCLEYLRDEVRSLSFNSKVYYKTASTYNEVNDICLVNAAKIFCAAVPQFTKLNKLHCYIDDVPFPKPVLKRPIYSRWRLETVIIPFLKKLNDMPDLNTISLVSYAKHDVLPMAILSAPKSLKALVARSSMYWTKLDEPDHDLDSIRAHQLLSTLDPDYPGLIQLYLADVWTPPVRIVTHQLQSLAINNQQDALINWEYLPLWNTFFARNGRVLKRLHLSLYYSRTDMLQTLWHSLPQLIHLEIENWYMPWGGTCDMDRVFETLKNEFPKLCGQLEYLTLPLSHKNISFKTLHGIANWTVNDSQPHEQHHDESNDESDDETDAVSHSLNDYHEEWDDFIKQHGTELLFGNLAKITFVKQLERREDEFTTNSFLNDYEFYTKETFPYIFDQVEFVKPSPWRIFHQDLVASKQQKQGYENYMTEEILKEAKYNAPCGRRFEYSLKLEMLRDIKMVHIPGNFQKRRQTSVMHEGRQVIMSELYPDYTEARCFISTSKKWY